ncbi:NAD(P)-dependent oxidoreductase [Legionella sp. CNM-4043-24]|uniref:NAD(P)-dependent oxidoreductase n=1 Tax=Legionella sp. CNM-4043-24 TaxID=3421646 RepID=UPI00403B0248
MKLLADASLPGLIDCFPAPFKLSLYHNEHELRQLLPDHDALLCRSTLKVTEDLLQGSQLRCIATASSGTDHIDKDLLLSKSIELFDARGSNASSVADYVLASIAWLDKNTAFRGKRALIIGYGAVGSTVARRLERIGYEVLAYDPLKGDGFQSCDLDEISRCDLICVHASLHDSSPHPSRGLLSNTLLQTIRTNAAIINAARGGIVDESALLALKPPLYYCTDVYSNEPGCHPGVIEFASLCTPHIAGHSVEAKLDAVRMASHSLHAYCQLKTPAWEPLQAEQELVLDGEDDWRDKVLALYNPEEETLGLKLAADKREAFLRLRKAHCCHDFGIRV